MNIIQASSLRRYKLTWRNLIAFFVKINDPSSVKLMDGSPEFTQNQQNALAAIKPFNEQITMNELLDISTSLVEQKSESIIQTPLIHREELS